MVPSCAHGAHGHRSRKRKKRSCPGGQLCMFSIVSCTFHTYIILYNHIYIDIPQYPQIPQPEDQVMKILVSSGIYIYNIYLYMVILNGSYGNFEWLVANSSLFFQGWLHHTAGGHGIRPLWLRVSKRKRRTRRCGQGENDPFGTGSLGWWDRN